MSTAAAPVPFITVEEYLEGEKLATVKHEYVNGRVYALHAMAGTSERHNLISLDTVTLLRAHLRGGPCRTFMADLKVEVKTDQKECYYYPDVFVTCDPTDDDPYIKRHPKLVVEVLSPSTWRSDFSTKSEDYRQIPSIEEIVLIAQDWPELVIFRRSDDWKAHAYTRLDSLVRLESVDFEAALSAFYESAPFPADVWRPWYLQERLDG